MKSKILGFITTTGAVIALSAAAFAQDAKPAPDITARQPQFEGYGHREGKMRDGKIFQIDRWLRMTQDLNLTDAQKQQAKQIIDNHNAATQPQRDELRKIWEQKRSGATLTADQENRARELFGQVRDADRKTRNDLIAILTPEQQTQLKQKQEEKRQRIGERWKMKHGDNNQNNAPPATNAKPQI
jgi:Spy/CpxP family protein refolding chaperone